MYNVRLCIQCVRDPHRGISNYSIGDFKLYVYDFMTYDARPNIPLKKMKKCKSLFCHTILKIESIG